MDHKHCCNVAREYSVRRKCASGLQRCTRRTRAHRLLSRPKSVLPCTIGCCRCQGARAIRRRVVSGNYPNRPSKKETASGTIKVWTVFARKRGSLLCGCVKLLLGHLSLELQA